MMSLDQFLVCENTKYVIENIIVYCVKEYSKSSYPPTFDTSAAKWAESAVLFWTGKTFCGIP